MNNQNDQLEALQDIRSIMERSTKFISLSGISGIFVGIIALAGAAFIQSKLNYDMLSGTFDSTVNVMKDGGIGMMKLILFTAVTVLGSSILVGIYFTSKKAKKLGQNLFDKSAQRLFINMLIPLATGGIVCLIILYHGFIFILAPLTLIFYGLALVNGSNYSIVDIRFLGIAEIILGLISLVFIGKGLLFWAIGFGVLHIVYGIVLYRKYDR